MTLVVFLLIGFAFQLAERFWPLRRYTIPRAYKLDMLAFVWVLPFSFAVRSLLGRPTVMAIWRIPGLGWMPAVAEGVRAHLPWPVMVLCSVVLIDLIGYFVHRLLHTSMFWRMHAFHHSPKHLYWLAGIRTSPVQVVLTKAVPPMLTLLWPFYDGKEAVCAYVVSTWIQHFTHANVRWQLGPLGWLFVTPRMHFVHHAAAPALNNKNFGFLLTIWDRMFGTYLDPDSVSNDFPLGLNYDVSTPRLLIGVSPPSPPNALPDSTEKAA